MGAYLLDWMGGIGRDGPGVGVKSMMVSTVLLHSYGLYRYMCSLVVVFSEIVIVPLALIQNVVSSCVDDPERCLRIEVCM